jgi:hypothetical protein
MYRYFGVVMSPYPAAAIFLSDMTAHFVFWMAILNSGERHQQYYCLPAGALKSLVLHNRHDPSSTMRSFHFLEGALIDNYIPVEKHVTERLKRHHHQNGSYIPKTWTLNCINRKQAKWYEDNGDNRHSGQVSGLDW